MWRALLVALPLCGCVTTDREVDAYLQRYYSKNEVDAINAEAECKRIARTLVQISRCSTRR
jgi:hypothetical protein